MTRKKRLERLARTVSNLEEARLCCNEKGKKILDGPLNYFRDKLEKEFEKTTPL